MAYKPKVATVAEGGTGVATLTGLALGNGTGAFTAATFVDVTSWTPDLQINGSSTGITYTTQTGGYTRLGNVVSFWFNIVLSNKGASTGNVTISNMPVSTGATGSNIFIPVNCFSVWTATANYVTVSLQLANSSTVGTFIESATNGSATANVTNTQIANTTTFKACSTYIIG